MQTFPKPVEIQLTPEMRQRALQFANQVVGTVNYADSNQSNRDKIRDDHFISKIGEEAVRQAFESLGLQVKGPDYTIYEGKKKSWQEDLLVDDIGLAVKTQKKTAAQHFGLSWTFQQSGFRNDPVLKDPFAWVCFVEYDDLGGERCRVFPPRQIRELVFKDPKLAHLKGKKRVVYAEDLDI